VPLRQFTGTGFYPAITTIFGIGILGIAAETVKYKVDACGWRQNRANNLNRIVFNSV
jgi:hypothetical protein